MVCLSWCNMVGDCSSFRPSSCINAARCRDVVQYPHLYSPWNNNVFHVQCTTTQHSSNAFPMSNVLAHTTAHNHSYTDSSPYYLVTMCSSCTFLLAQCLAAILSLSLLAALHVLCPLPSSWQRMDLLQDRGPQPWSSGHQRSPWVVHSYLWPMLHTTTGIPNGVSVGGYHSNTTCKAGKSTSACSNLAVPLRNAQATLPGIVLQGHTMLMLICTHLFHN